MKTLITSRCINQRGAGHKKHHLAYLLQHFDLSIVAEIHATKPPAASTK
jgi:hypothetical protein